MSTATEKPTIDVHVRWMIRRDMEEVLQIDRSVFARSWGEEDYVRCLRRRNNIGFVAEKGDRVLGFMVYELHRTRLHLIRLGVCHTAWGFGIGRQMVEKLQRKLSWERRTTITTEVWERNQAALLFLSRLGFLATGCVIDCADCAPGDDAIAMRYSLPHRDASLYPHAASMPDAADSHQ